VRLPGLRGALSRFVTDPHAVGLGLVRVPSSSRIKDRATYAGQVGSLLAAMLGAKCDLDVDSIAEAANTAGELGDAIGEHLGGELGGPPIRARLSTVLAVAAGPAPRFGSGTQVPARIK
jgi:hypothetical protein